VVIKQVDLDEEEALARDQQPTTRKSQAVWAAYKLDYFTPDRRTTAQCSHSHFPFYFVELRVRTRRLLSYLTGHPVTADC